jgi:signal transduction histidine kinase
MFAALPIGLCRACAPTAASASRNRRRPNGCVPRRARAGVELERQAPGEVAFGGIAVRVRRVALPDGELVLLEDRSHVQELEREVHRLDRLAGLSELALGIAHEIKNPLNGVHGLRGAAGAFSEDPAADAPRFAGKVVQGVRQVDDIVKSLLGFARAGAQARARRHAWPRVVAESAQAAGSAAVRVQLQRRARAERVDADALVRVLTNLFRNALEAAPGVHVTVHAQVRLGRLELTVHDDGPGIPAEPRPPASMEPFLSTKERGTGLGLSLCGARAGLPRWRSRTPEPR